MKNANHELPEYKNINIYVHKYVQMQMKTFILVLSMLIFPYHHHHCMKFPTTDVIINSRIKSSSKKTVFCVLFAFLIFIPYS